jgi:hypothetical protein
MDFWHYFDDDDDDPDWQENYNRGTGWVHW